MGASIHRQTLHSLQATVVTSTLLEREKALTKGEAL